MRTTAAFILCLSSVGHFACGAERDLPISGFADQRRVGGKGAAEAFRTGRAPAASPTRPAVMDWGGEAPATAAIRVAQVVPSDRQAAPVDLQREIFIDKPHMWLPVRNNAPKRLMRFLIDGQLARQFEIEFAEGEPDFWTDADVSPYLGKTMRIELDGMPEDSPALGAVTLSDRLPGGDDLYRESLRPQFHFSPARGWTNDPNGLTYYDGEYHLFFQHNPYGVRWGNMTWGHAVSPDLIHWQQLADAIHLDELGTIYSGSAVVDQGNTTGWANGQDQPIVCIYTSAGGKNVQSQGQPFTQSIAYSTDRGRTWVKYERNPVLGHINAENRDPKVFWHEPSGQWVMILYLAERGRFALFASHNLKQWTKLSDLPFPDGHECPDLFELPVDGDPANRRWVAWEGGGRYLIGQFDGAAFHADSGPHASKFGANDYAAQTYSDIPAADGRRIQIAWMSGGKYPDMPFNQQMTIPRVLTLRTTEEGIRLFFQPVQEVESLRTRQHAWQNLALDASPEELPNIEGPLLDVEVEFQLGAAQSIGVTILGHTVQYLVGERRLTALGKKAPLAPQGDRLKLRLLADRTSLEVFAQDGRVHMASCWAPEPAAPPLKVYALGEGAQVVRLNVWELRSIWGR